MDSREPNLAADASPRAAAQKLDPLLRIAASRADVEALSDFRKFHESAPVALPSLKGLPTGLQTLATQVSPKAASELLTDDGVPVLINTTSAKSALGDLGKLDVSDTEALTETLLAARIPRSSLGALAAAESVVFVEASTRLRPHCDLAHASAGLIRGGSRLVAETGRGVLVGVVDTGLDTQHPAFSQAGSTRVVSYFDQVTGRKYSQAEIQAGAAAASSPDTDGHGTHVAGIAAGNGAQSPDDGWAGVAPEADIAAVKTTFDTDAIARGVKHLFDIADARSQPCVVNLSLGGHFGAHDGSSVLERVIDQLSGAGRVVVVSAGNEGRSAIHAELTFPRGRTSAARAVADFALSPRLVDNSLIGLLDFQVWCSREDLVDVQVRSPSGETFSVSNESEFTANRDKFVVSGVHSRGIYNEDHVYTFRLIRVCPERSGRIA